MQRSSLLLALVLTSLASIATAQVTDTTPPQLDGPASGFDPLAIDVTGGSAIVTVTLSVTDDLSGVTFNSPVNFPGPSMLFQSPSGAQSRRLTGFQLIGGDPLNGQWQASVEFPQFIEAGVWTVAEIVLEDLVGNTATLDTATLDSLGFVTTLQVDSISDATPPELVSFDIDPLNVDTSASQESVLVTMELSDDTSGVDFNNRPPGDFTIGVLSPVGNFIRVCNDPFLVAGTPQTGTWTSNCFFPQYSQQGQWPIFQLALRDAAGNVTQISSADLDARGFPSGVALTSTPSDTTPPLLPAFDFQPKFIDTSAGNAQVVGTLDATDDISGFSGMQVDLRSPSGGQLRRLFIFQLTAGTNLDGSFTGTVDFPQFSEAGSWRVDNAFFYDNVFNYVSLNTAALVGLGFPTILNVVLPSLENDGQIDVGGGTVEDQVFGNRAQVTLPPGAVNGPTDVAIDVLESPLLFDMPTGFAAPGTRFVNISFDPVPPMPFPAPGATVVLPLVDPMPAGTALALYRVDPGTGSLVAAISVGGGPVIGLVAADGLSATFTGVSRLSVVVGLIPDNEAPTVTAPASITIPATEATGARGSASAALAAFLAGGSAIDNLDPAPARLTPQMAGVDVDASTLFGLGTSTVTFRFQDTAQNIGTASAEVNVVTGRPKLSGAVTGKSTPSAGVRQVTVTLSNKGNGNARNVRVNKLVFKTLSGSGAVTLAGPALPVVVGNLDVGGASALQLTLNVPASVTRFSITESGTMTDIVGTRLSFSSAQSIIP